MNRQGYIEITVALIFVAIAIIGVGFYLREQAPFYKIPSTYNASSTSNPHMTSTDYTAGTSTQSSTTTFPSAVQFNADPNYYKAVDAASVMACRGSVSLIEITVKALPALLTDYSFRANCGLNLEGIDVNYGSSPQVHNLSSDNRLPISLSEWKISAQKAIQISGLIIQQNEADLDLLQESSTLVWNINQGGDYTRAIQIDATTGKILSDKTSITPCGAVGQCE